MRLRIVACLLAVAALAGCGQSAADKAQTKVCNARDDMAKQVDKLKGMTLTTATTDQVKESVQAIQKDLSTIASAMGDLSDQKRKDVQAANHQFVSTVKETASNVGTSVSIGSGKAQVQQALDQLATSYQQTFGKLDCGS